MSITRQMLYTYFLILLPVISEENEFEASTDYDTCTDAELDASFECITRMPVFPENYLICNATLTELFLNEAGISFTMYTKSPQVCKMESQLVGNCSMRPYEMLHPIHICLIMIIMNQRCQHCKNVTAIHIIKPEAPFDLKSTFQEKANEYLVDFSTLHVRGSLLDHHLTHELAYRQEKSNWTTREFQYKPFKLLGKELYPGATYEIRVRSKPNGEYFKGTWSEWSPSEYQKIPDKINYYTFIVIIVSIVGFLLLLILISLIPVFWENRIKPIVWPTLPTHEKALDKLCKKLRENSDASFFTPENLGYVHIHKVDSIEAKAKPDCFQPSCLPWDTAVLEKLGNELEQKSNMVLINHGWLKLPLAYEGMWPAEMLNQHLGRRNPATGGNVFISANPYHESEESSSSSQPSNNDTVSSCSTSSVDTLSGLQADPCPHTYTNNKTRVPNIEEAYVTMASFFENKGN
ncbi:interleukin-7 receptor subunit alpha [Sceloporus undulatus]|uniref:interleukin-7 receptor subunit alpha n=1 Tax=Sceloporus undulatus TaxID=8520 RepID=UPI001C4B293F|nr:interleukin-7 receptor subunit alpha [Sceloporus undulatus]